LASKDAECEELHQRLSLITSQKEGLQKELQEKNDRLASIEKELLLLRSISTGIREKVDGMLQTVKVTPSPTIAPSVSTPSISLTLDHEMPPPDNVKRTPKSSAEWNEELTRAMEESERMYAQKADHVEVDTSLVAKKEDSKKVER
jgi:hypothetical protein